MRWKLNLVLLILVLLIFNGFNGRCYLSAQSKPTRQSAMEAYSSGNYEKAYKDFSELLKIYSKDPLYKYYSGVCLVRLNMNPDEAVELLSQALKGAAIVRTLPQDALFYLGRAQQMSGKFDDAAMSYNQFSEQAGKKVSRELGVPDFLQQCQEGKGAIAAELQVKAETKIPAKEPEKVNTTTVAKTPVPEKKNNPQSVLPADYDRMLDEALILQHRADSVNSLTVSMKQELAVVPAADKAAYRIKISEMETLAVNLQNSADKKYEQAQEAMSVKQNTAEPVRTEVVKEVVVQDVPKEEVKEAVSKVPVIPGTLSCFEIVALTDNQLKEKIVIDGVVPEGLIYRIQIAVFRNPVSQAYFKGITPVFGFRVEGTDKTNYYAGMFRKTADAGKALGEVRGKGFKDAFTVALWGNKPVSADRAKLLEKEWGEVPFTGCSEDGVITPADTVPPELVFRVEVLRTEKPLKPEAEEAVRKLAGSRGMDIQNYDEETIVYLIGKFITFESAAEYTDLLIRNGYREAKVVAFMGRKEIAVETAKQLFDNIK